MAPGALAVVWGIVDAFLRRVSERLQRIVRLLRLVRVLLVVGILAVLGSAAVGLWKPNWFPYAYAVAAVFLVVPLAALAALTGLPLKARSAVRLIDQGYPENARELAIRLVARKMRDQSIETEELLVETAINEGKKIVRRLKDEELARAVAQDPPSPPGGPGAP